MHATGITSFNTSISQIHNYSTSMTLILSPPYLKTIVMLQSFLSIQHTQKKVSQILNIKHIIIKQITMLLRDSQNNLSEAWEINSFFKTNPPPCSKRSKWSTRAKIITLKRYKWSTMSKLSSSKDISEAHRVFYQILIHVWLSQKVCTARMIVAY